MYKERERERERKRERERERETDVCMFLDTLQEQRKDITCGYVWESVELSKHVLMDNSYH